MLNKILMVCVGNICRSPMAEIILRQRALEKNLQLSIGSAGISALVGHPVDPYVREILQAAQMDSSSHRARQLSEQMIFDADLVLTMEDRHRREIEYLYPNACGKVHLIGKWTRFEVPDPYKKPKPFFQDTYHLITKGIDEWIVKLWK